MSEGTSRSGLSREERRARTQKKLRLGALERQYEALQRMKSTPFFNSMDSVKRAEDRYNANVAKWKKKRPEWF